MYIHTWWPWDCLSCAYDVKNLIFSFQLKRKTWLLRVDYPTVFQSLRFIPPTYVDWDEYIRIQTWPKPWRSEWIEGDFDFRSLQFAMSCWYQVVRFIYLISQFFVVFQQGPLLEVVEVRNNRGQELVTRVSGYSGPMRYVTFSFSLAICCSSSCVCQNKSRMHINLGEQQYLCYRLMQ